MPTLEDEFADLEDAIRRLIGLLEEADEKYWVPVLQRGLAQVVDHRLSGATFILGCFGGEGTLSDVVIGANLEHADPLRMRNQNARLGHLRTAVFEAANIITSRRSW